MDDIEPGHYFRGRIAFLLGEITNLSLKARKYDICMDLNLELKKNQSFILY